MRGQLSGASEDLIGIGGSHLRIYPEWSDFVKKPNGKVDINAMVLLAEIVSWYTPKRVEDEDGNTWSEDRYEERMLRKSYAEIRHETGLTDDRAKSAFKTLESLGIARRVASKRYDDGSTSYGTVMYIELDTGVLLPMWEKSRAERSGKPQLKNTGWSENHQVNHGEKNNPGLKNGTNHPMKNSYVCENHQAKKSPGLQNHPPKNSPLHIELNTYRTKGTYNIEKKEEEGTLRVPEGLRCSPFGETGEGVMPHGAVGAGAPAGGEEAPSFAGAAPAQGDGYTSPVFAAVLAGAHMPEFFGSNARERAAARAEDGARHTMRFATREDVAEVVQALRLKVPVDQAYADDQLLACAPIVDAMAARCCAPSKGAGRYLADAVARYVEPEPRRGGKGQSASEALGRLAGWVCLNASSRQRDAGPQWSTSLDFGPQCDALDACVGGLDSCMPL